MSILLLNVYAWEVLTESPNELYSIDGLVTFLLNSVQNLVFSGRVRLCCIAVESHDFKGSLL